MVIENNMVIRTFDKQKDYATICSWNYNHGVHTLVKESLPEIGYIIDGVVAGFLYQTDSDVAIIEGYTSNKHSDKNERRDGLVLLTETLLNRATELNFKNVLYFSNNKNVHNLFNKFDFNITQENISLGFRRL